MTFKNTALVLALALGSTTMLRCAGEESGTEPDSSGSAGSETSMSLAAEPAGAQDVIVVKQAAQEGQEVVVYGRLREFTPGYASFILTDQAMKHCAEREGDNCPTPWDYCCESATDVAEHSLIVEFRDGDKPRRLELEGQDGLEKLADVVVKGKVVDVADGNVIIAAEGVFVRG